MSGHKDLRGFFWGGISERDQSLANLMIRIKIVEINIDIGNDGGISGWCIRAIIKSYICSLYSPQ